MSRFAKYAWALLALNLLVILWGAVVRATGAGAGCGSHWPLCNGVVVPIEPAIETMIEFFHRVTSALLGLLTIGLVVWAGRRYGRGHWVFRAAIAALVLVIIEGLLGAALVRFELVAGNTSVVRGFVAALHLVNTLLLTAAYTLTAWWASGGETPQRPRGGLALWLGLGLGLTMLLGATGAVTALGATLFPAGTMVEGLRQDFDPNSPLILQIRVIHPTISILVTLYLWWLARRLMRRFDSPPVRRFGRGVMAMLAVQLVVGVVNLALHAPVWMQLVHLLLADLLWIALVLLSVAALAAQRPVVALNEAVRSRREPQLRSHPR
ncbi:MAG: COX15/CtaA family protein [Anaerolineales bacterium]|nr:COX15/CtaA family protein [Anaerolineales bacterium]MCB9127620.1 COX15/CtaA family protein [Ardenticatenales bacterium]